MIREAEYEVWVSRAVLEDQTASSVEQMARKQMVDSLAPNGWAVVGGESGITIGRKERYRKATDGTGAWEETLLGDWQTERWFLEANVYESTPDTPSPLWTP